jgi:hypothetical protein
MEHRQHKRPTLRLPTVTVRGSVPAPAYVVWGDADRCKRPSRKHPNEQAARAEAARLAERHPGESFRVYKLTLLDRVGPV